MTDHMLTCEELELLLPDHLEGELDAASRARVERHLAGCAACAALVGDLDAIRRDAAALPVLAPSRDLWGGIEERIERDAVIAIPVAESSATAADLAPATPVPKRNAGRGLAWRWQAAAAAVLVAVSSGVTYLATRPDAGPAQVATTGATPAVAGRDVPAPFLLPDAPAAGTTTPEAAAPEAAEPARSAATRPAAAAPRTPVVTNVRDVTTVEASPVERDIAAMRAILAERRAMLDTATVSAIERNLKIIDEAIANSRAALERDPASQFLAGQLNTVLERKLELLRTAALLPART